MLNRTFKTLQNICLVLAAIVLADLIAEILNVGKADILQL